MSGYTQQVVRESPRGCPTSVQRITLPLALNSEPWKILTLVMDSMDFPSMGLMTLKAQGEKKNREMSKKMLTNQKNHHQLSMTARSLPEWVC